MNFKDFNSDSIIESLIDEVEIASKKRLETLAKDALKGMAANIILADRISKMKAKPSKVPIVNGLSLDDHKMSIMNWLGQNMTINEIKMELQRMNFVISATSISNYIHKLRKTTFDIPLSATLGEAIILFRSHGYSPTGIQKELNELGFKTNRGVPITANTIWTFYHRNYYLNKDYRFQHNRLLDVAPQNKNKHTKKDSTIELSESAAAIPLDLQV
jgi:hypothetical protein